MKRILFALVASLPVAAAAIPTGLDLAIESYSSSVNNLEFTVTAGASVAGSPVDAEFRFALERVYPVPATVKAWPWSTAKRVHFGESVEVPGEYRLRVSTRQADREDVVLSRDVPLQVISRHQGFLLGTQALADITARYDHAIAVLRQAMDDLRQTLADGQDVTAQCNALATADSAIVHVINPEGDEAPEGEGAFVVGPADDVMGAIGIAGTGCSDPADPSGMYFEVSSPDYSDMPDRPVVTIYYGS